MELGFETVILLFAFIIFTNAENNKRLVLHSDVDIAQEIINLKTEVLALKSDNAAKDVEIANIRQNFTNQLLKIDSDRQSQDRIISNLQKVTKDIVSTYVRWGRTTCDANGTDVVYTGFAGGSRYNEEGGAANFVCLPQQPTWAKYHDGVQNEGGHMYGAEYNSDYLSSFNPFNMVTGQQDDVPCVVCRAPFVTTIMIPAMTSCYLGWHQQYTGYLMTGRSDHKSATEFICVDANPEKELHGEKFEGGEVAVLCRSCLWFTTVSDISEWTRIGMRRLLKITQYFRSTVLSVCFRA